jgi:hypothetical protein
MSEPGKIWIKLHHATLHRIGPRHTGRIDLICGMNVPAGNPDTIEIPPGTAFEIEEGEGLRLLAVHDGEVVEDAAP